MLNFEHQKLNITLKLMKLKKVNITLKIDHTFVALETVCNNINQIIIHNLTYIFEILS